MVNQKNYRLGEKLVWGGPFSRPDIRPLEGNLKTIGYFNCDNPGCPTWHDCFPEVQEALIVVQGDVISEVTVVSHNPGSLTFDIVD